MYGKHFASMYEGSMVGAGATVFAVWGYVIANYRLDKVVGAQVRLNSIVLSTILGESQGSILQAINFLCAPDPRSTTKEEGGRRLIKIGEFDYRVVNGAKYTAIRNEEERRESNRIAKRRERERNATVPLKRSGTAKSRQSDERERRYVDAVKNGDQAACDRIAAEGLKP